MKERDMHVKTVDVTIPRLTAGKSAVPRIFPWLSRFIFVTAETADFFRSCLFNCGFFPRLPVNLRFPRFILLPWTFPWYRGFPRGWALLVALLEFSVLWNCAKSLFEQCFSIKVFFRFSDCRDFLSCIWNISGDTHFFFL